MNISEKTAVRSEINVTPLVDVCLVLLIIFMVVTPLVYKQTDVQLPRTPGPGEIGQVDRQIKVAILEDGRIQIDGLPSARSSEGPLELASAVLRDGSASSTRNAHFSWPLAASAEARRLASCVRLKVAMTRCRTAS